MEPTTEELVTQAESSPAESPAPVVDEPSFVDRYKKWSGKEQKEYDLTGTEPVTIPAEPAGKSETESAPVKQEQRAETPEERSKRDREKSQRRQADYWGPKLQEERKRAEAAERRLAELEKKPESAPGAPKAAVPGRPVRPKLADFDTVEAYEAAVDVHEDKLADWKLDQRDALRKQESERVQRDQEEAEAAERQRGAFEGFQGKVLEYIGTDKQREAEYHGARDEVAAFFANLPEKHPLGKLEGLIMEAQMPELVIYLAKHPDEFEQMVKRPTLDAVFAEFGEIKATVKAALKKAPQPSTRTLAPDPPVKLGGASETVSGPKPGTKAWHDQENDKDLRRLGLK